MENEQIKRRYDQLFQERRGNFDQDADLIERYIAPIRGGKFFQDQSNEYEVQFRRPEIYDSTARKSAGILKASIQGALLPSGVKWFDLLFRADDLNDDKEAKEWLEDCGLRMFLAMEDSRFQLSSEESIADIVDFGNTVMILEERMKDGVFEGLFYDAIDMRGIYFDEDWDNSIHTLYRRLQWTPLQIASKFPEDQLPDAVREKLDGETEISQRMDVIFCVYPRDVPEPDGLVTPEKRPWGGKYVLHEDSSLIGEEMGYYEMPAFIARWGKTSGSKYGWGPGNIALPDVLTINNMVRDELAYVEKIIDPPSLVSERNVFSDLDLTAGGVTLVQDIDGVQSYPVGDGYGQARMSMEDLRNRIEDHYYVNELQLKESPAMTATEAAMRREEILKMFGPMRGRFETELLSEVLQRTFNIMYRNGQFKEVPKSLANVGPELDIKYTGPAARAQRSESIAALERLAAFVGGTAEIFPEIRDNVDPDSMFTEVMEALDVPAKVRKSDNEIADTRDKRDAMAKAQAEAQVAQEQGAGMQAVAEGEQALQAVQ